MQNENNNSRNWKQKLENIDAFPDDMRMNKEDAWRKLDAKLQHKPKRRKAFWYWVAAACLLPLLFLLFPALHHNGSDIAKKNLHTNNTVKPSGKEKIVAQKEVVIAKLIVPVVRKKIQTKKSANITSNADEKQVLTLPVSKDSNTQNMAAITTNLNDSNSTKTIASTQQIKKLKVVHINELGEPEDASDMAHVFYLHSLPFQIARGETYATSTRKTSLDSTRLKLFRFN